MVHMKRKKERGSLKENVALKECWWIGQSYIVVSKYKILRGISLLD